jgi:hypothetical protein
MSYSADLRAAAVDLLTAYAASAGTRLQVYRARPTSIYAPTAFVDGMGEKVEYLGPSLMQRTPTVELLVVHGLFDGGEAVDQRDVFVDGFLAYVATRYHEAGANTLLGITVVDDLPDFVPTWLAPEKQKTYYATRITLEGLSQS